DPVNCGLPQLPPFLRAECELVLEAGLRAVHDVPARQLRVTAGKPDSWKPEPRLSLEGALRLLAHPFSVMVENSRNDAAFLRRLSGRWHKQLELALKEKRLCFRHGGGITEIAQQVQAIDDEYERERLFVMVDSDASMPGRPSAQAQKVERLCREQHLPHHVLQRSRIENYLPLPVLKTAPDYWKDRDKTRLRRLVQAFAELSEEQRHHFPMKKGLGSAPPALFSECPPICSTGFGNDIAELFGERYREKQVHWKDQWTRHDRKAIDECEAIVKTLFARL
ncbi:MAG: hypothetical protein RBU37_16045, partial [Myxococcota bacterium]|nr:hypothetical protein [Myxococcota bacterium]